MSPSRATALVLKLDVIAPKFVKVLNKSTELRKFGPTGNDVVFGSVEIGIDTTAAGEFRGELTVTLGQTTVQVPVSATVKARRAADCSHPAACRLFPSSGQTTYPPASR